MFQVYFVFFILIMCIPIGIFVLRIIDKNNEKFVKEEIALVPKSLETEREERAEKFREEIRIRMAEFKEEERKNRILEEEQLAKAKLLKKEIKEKKLVEKSAKEKLLKREIKEKEIAEKVAKEQLTKKDDNEKERIDEILKKSRVSLDHNNDLIDLAIFFSFVNTSATLKNHFITIKNIKDEDYKVKSKIDYKIVVFTSCFYAFFKIHGLSGCDFNTNGLSKQSTRLYFKLGEMSYNSQNTRDILEIYNESGTPELSDYFKDSDLLLHSILYYRMCIIFSEIFKDNVNINSVIWDNSVENVRTIYKKLDEVVENLFNDSRIRNMLGYNPSLNDIRTYSGYTGTCIPLCSFIYKIKINPTKEINYLTLEELRSVMDGFDDSYFEDRDWFIIYITETSEILKNLIITKKRKCLKVVASKIKQDQIFPLLSQAIELLDSIIHLHSDNEYIFVGREGKDSFQKI